MPPTPRRRRSSLALVASPAPDASEPPCPRPVFSRLTLLGVKEISTASQTWQGDLAFEFLFCFPRPSFCSAEELQHAQTIEGVLELEPRAAVRDEKVKDLQFVFWPEVSDTSETEAGQTEVWVSRMRGGSHGALQRIADAYEIAPHQAHKFNFVSFSLRTRARFTQRFQLWLFPFDCAWPLSSRAGLRSHALCALSLALTFCSVSCPHLFPPHARRAIWGQTSCCARALSCGRTTSTGAL